MQTNPENAYRNGAMYSSYTAAANPTALTLPEIHDQAQRPRAAGAAPPH